MNEDFNRMQLQLDKHSGQIAKLFSKIDDTNAKIQKIDSTVTCILSFMIKKSSKNSKKITNF